VSGSGLVPNVAEGWPISPDGRRTTLILRKGMRWSDGAPFTADDFVFWLEKMHQNKDVVPTPAPEMSVNGKPARVTKVDEVTIAFDFEEPYFLFPYQLAADTFVGGGPSRHQSDGRAHGLYAPAHYLAQFLPDQTPVAVLNQQAKAAGCDSWVQHFLFKIDWRLNRELPTLAAYRMVQPITGQSRVLERNRYFYKVDTEGNQLLLSTGS